MARRRLFAALLLTGRVSDEVEGLRRALGSSEIDRVRPHVTLAAPVNVPEAELEAAVSVLRRAASRSGPVSVSLGPPATFWPSVPVCYLAVSGDVGAIAALRRDLVEETGPLAPPPARADREFVPHVTVNQNIEPGRIPSALEALADYRAEVVFDRVTLLEHLEPERRWVPLADALLGPPAVHGRGGLEVTVSAGSRLDPQAAVWAGREWEQYSIERYGPEVGAEEPFALVAQVGGEIAGVADGELWPPVCLLGRLVVAPAWRSHGVGSRLLAETEQLALSRGSDRVRVEAVAGGREVGFYRGKGYEVVSVLHRWRAERDVVVMERVVRA